MFDKCGSIARAQLPGLRLKASTKLMSCSPSSSQQSDSKIPWMILVLASLMFLPALGSTGILNTTDAYYTEAAREMLSRGDFITPHLNYSPYYFKPILTYWLIISSYLVFGVSTFAARLPSALSAIATALVLYSLSRPFIGRRAAVFAALSLVSMPLFVVVGHIALTDMPLILLTTITNLLLLRALVFKTSKGLTPAYICLGLAMLSKGPLAIAVVGICIGGFLLVSSRSIDDFKNRLLSLKPLLAAVISLAVALPWFIAEHIASKGEFTKFFFLEQNVGRLSGKAKSHTLPVWFYVPYIMGGFVPWIPLLFGAPFLVKPTKETRFSDSPRTQICIASLCWIFGTLGLLMLSASKVAHYLLPVAPAVAILTGVFLDTVIRLGRRRYMFWIAPGMVLGCTAGLFIVPRLIGNAPDLRTAAILGIVVFLLGYIAYGVFVFKSKLRAATVTLTGLSLVTCAAMVPLGLEYMYRQGNESFEYLIKRANSLDGSNIAVLANESPIAAFYAEKKVFEFTGPYDCREFVAKTDGPHYVIVDSKYLPLFTAFFPKTLQQVSSKGKWMLLSIESSDKSKSSISSSNSQKLQ